MQGAVSLQQRSIPAAMRHGDDVLGILSIFDHDRTTWRSRCGMLVAPPWLVARYSPVPPRTVVGRAVVPAEPNNVKPFYWAPKTLLLVVDSLPITRVRAHVQLSPSVRRRLM